MSLPQVREIDLRCIQKEQHDKGNLCNKMQQVLGAFCFDYIKVGKDDPEPDKHHRCGDDGTR